ncbi:SUKH-4 family immunity protein [Kitasatospora sp. NBC_00240]|uniref:SUKH-4 family immunity protein n=1 Tax=Kitasatospora sp. NBC_00240 TaxID=2903567 RepID=UPI00225881B6|nr:SUKH-4 family immunity protein [Kitasatospora sp. NBC_00240]MCX5213858.1 SUKH-4 family immunity protein [Kitasatospora sp. NBC_00240]
MDERFGTTAEDLTAWCGEHAVARVPSDLLPEALTHAPSRHFLVEAGLPAAEGGLRLLEGAGSGLPTFAEIGGADQVPGGGGLLVLGTTEDRNAEVVLDMADGRVYLAAPGRGGAPLLDLLASDLSRLVGLIREVAALTRAARDPAVLDGARGPEIARVVAEVAEDRMRAVDPEVFHPLGPAPHWSTAVLLASLGWGARPGGPGELAHVLTPELVADLMEPDDDEGEDEGDVTVYRFSSEELPPELTHEPTRRLLAEVGLPVGYELFQAGGGPLRPLAQARPRWFEALSEEPETSDSPRAANRDRLYLGTLGADIPIALDGATGRLEALGTGDGIPYGYLNQDVSALLHVCWIIETLTRERSRWEYEPPVEWQAFDVQQTLRCAVDTLVEAVDPPAFAQRTHPWRTLAEDPWTQGLIN